MSEIDTSQIAQLLGYSRKHVTDRLVKQPNFPKPCQNNSPKKRRWRFDEVLKFKRGEC